MEKTRRDISARFTSFWWGDQGLSAFLLLLFAAIFLSPLLEHRPGRLLVGIFFTLLLVSGVANISTHILFRIGAGLVACAAITCSWLRDFSPGRTATALWALFSLLAFALMTLVLLRQVFRAGPVTSHRVKGAIAVYILFALSWAYLYILIDLLVPGAFSMPAAVGPMGTEERDVTLAYFSFVTLTTLGYGDITAVHPTARMFVIMEALMGQLYPATLLARLVSLAVMHQNERPADRSLDETGKPEDP